MTSCLTVHTKRFFATTYCSDLSPRVFRPLRVAAVCKLLKIANIRLKLKGKLSSLLLHDGICQNLSFQNIFVHNIDTAVCFAEIFQYDIVQVMLS